MDEFNRRIKQLSKAVRLGKIQVTAVPNVDPISKIVYALATYTISEYGESNIKFAPSKVGQAQYDYLTMGNFSPNISWSKYIHDFLWAKWGSVPMRVGDNTALYKPPRKLTDKEQVEIISKSKRVYFVLNSNMVDMKELLFTEAHGKFGFGDLTLVSRWVWDAGQQILVQKY